MGFHRSEHTSVLFHLLSCGTIRKVRRTYKEIPGTVWCCGNEHHKLDAFYAGDARLLWILPDLLQSERTSVGGKVYVFMFPSDSSQVVCRYQTSRIYGVMNKKIIYIKKTYNGNCMNSMIKTIFITRRVINIKKVINSTVIIIFTWSF